MAEHKWIGSGYTVPIRVDGVLHQPAVKAIRLHRKDGTRATINAANQTTGFVQDESLGEISDERCVRHCVADPKTDTV